MERINLLKLQKENGINNIENLVFSAGTVGFRWNCDSAWFNSNLEQSNGSLRWKRLIY